MIKPILGAIVAKEWNVLSLIAFWVGWSSHKNLGWIGSLSLFLFFLLVAESITWIISKSIGGDND